MIKFLTLHMVNNWDHQNRDTEIVVVPTAITTIQPSHRGDMVVCGSNVFLSNGRNYAVRETPEQLMELINSTRFARQQVVR